MQRWIKRLPDVCSIYVEGKYASTFPIVPENNVASFLSFNSPFFDLPCDLSLIMLVAADKLTHFLDIIHNPILKTNKNYPWFSLIANIKSSSQHTFSCCVHPTHCFYIALAIETYGSKKKKHWKVVGSQTLNLKTIRKRFMRGTCWNNEFYIIFTIPFFIVIKVIMNQTGTESTLFIDKGALMNDSIRKNLRSM